jgi:hypothetical protein
MPRKTPQNPGLNDLSPQRTISLEYLQHLFERLPKAKTSEIKSLTPAAWLKAKHAAACQST